MMVVDRKPLRLAGSSRIAAVALAAGLAGIISILPAIRMPPKPPDIDRATCPAGSKMLRNTQARPRSARRSRGAPVPLGAWMRLPSSISPKAGPSTSRTPLSDPVKSLRSTQRPRVPLARIAAASDAPKRFSSTRRPVGCISVRASRAPGSAAEKPRADCTAVASMKAWREGPSKAERAMIISATSPARLTAGPMLRKKAQRSISTRAAPPDTSTAAVPEPAIALSVSAMSLLDAMSSTVRLRWPTRRPRRVTLRLRVMRISGASLWATSILAAEKSKVTPVTSSMASVPSQRMTPDSTSRRGVGRPDSADTSACKALSVAGARSACSPASPNTRPGA